MQVVYVIYTLLWIYLLSSSPYEHCGFTLNHTNENLKSPSLIILGTIQDAGSPQIACRKECCIDLFNNPDHNRMVVSLGLLDAEHDKTYLFEATPDIGRQVEILSKYQGNNENDLPDGIFLTHAHIGHYSGLMYLGKEAMDADRIEVYSMPLMEHFLLNNGPWDQLVKGQNIVINKINGNNPIVLSSALKVIPIRVPHRDEYSETVGYKIIGPNKSALFIPDIDKWEKWDRDILAEIKSVDYAFLDATFYSGEEIGNRDISQIPHPFIIESMDKFSELGPKEKNKIIFIHFNHNNPVILPESKESNIVIQQGYRIARLGDIFDL